MYIISNDDCGQLGGLVEIPDLKVGKSYIISDVLYKEGGFPKVDEYRTKNKFIFLVSDKWGNRPRTFEHAPGISDMNGGELIGNVIITTGQLFIIAERRTDNKQDPYITIMEITDFNEDIDVMVKEKFRYSQYGRYIYEHRYAFVLKVARDLLDTEVVDYNLKSLYRSLPETSAI